MKPTKKPRVDRITISRLFNLGNYELSVEVPEGESARNALLDVARIIKGVGPVKAPYGYQAAKDLLNKPYTSISPVEAEKIEEARKLVAEFDGAVNYRDECLQRLDGLGGTRVHKDAKDDWDDRCPF